MTYLLDTNVISEMWCEAPHANVKAWVDSVAENEMSLSVLTLAELRKGIEKLRHSTTGDVSTRERRSWVITALEMAILKITSNYGARVLSVTADVADEWGRLRAQKDVDRFDLGIAATARRNGLTVVTRNLDDFRRRGVRVLDPFSRPPKVYEPGE
jgi:predicted nucleic acid-binding protein